MSKLDMMFLVSQMGYLSLAPRWGRWILTAGYAAGYWYFWSNT